MMQNRMFIDTNVFLRFLIEDNKNPKLSSKAKEIFSLLQKRKIQLQTNTLIIAEVVYVLKSYYGNSKIQIKELLIPILSLPNLIIKDKETILASLYLFAEKNIDFEDAFTYFEMLNEDIDKIVTFDEKHFGRLENITILGGTKLP